MIPHVFEQVLQPIREVASELSDAPGAVLHGARADELPKREGTVPLHGKLGELIARCSGTESSHLFAAGRRIRTSGFP
jgi:hypothetical protein